MKRFPLLALGALALAGCGNSHSSALSTVTRTVTTTVPSSVATSTSAATTATVTASTTSAPRCHTAELAVWIGLGEGGAGAGSTYYPLELSNVSKRACHLFGFPGVSAYGGHQLGSPAQRNRAVPARTVLLAAGETAHTLVRISDVANFPRSQCAPVNAFGLTVIAPDETSSVGVPFSFRACSKAGPVFLSVGTVEPGVGIPGYTG